jgi:hypothetical protein
MITATLPREQNRLRPKAALRSRGTSKPTPEFENLGAVVTSHNANWISLTTSAPKSKRGTRPGSFDSFGLWKADGAGQLLFEVPVPVCQAVDEEHSRGLPGVCPRSIAEWVYASLRGEVPQGWTPPARDLVDLWMPPGALTLQLGPLLRQIELILEPSRWALRVAIVPSVSADLPRSRVRCLQELAVDAEQQWRLVRVCLVKRPEGYSLMAGVDLTGAPHSEALFLACLDGLRHVVDWLAETADLLADVTVTLRSPEVWQTKTKQEKGK